ncbi:MAG TPA: hypothetical protein VF070_42995 [Streptosporangiaceae bacterium]
MDAGAAAGGEGLGTGDPDEGVDGVALGVTGAGDTELLGRGEWVGRADWVGLAEPVGLGDCVGALVEGVDLCVGV